MNWYYLDNGAQSGPITDAEFTSLAEQGVINTSTYLWCEGMADWKTYGELTGVAAPGTAKTMEASAARSIAPTPQFASPMLRIVASLIDTIIIGSVFFGCGNLVKWASQRSVENKALQGVLLLAGIGLLLVWSVDYFTGRVARRGATMGQSLLGLRVVADNGLNIGFLRSLGRFAVLIIVNQLTMFLAQIVAFFDAQKRCLHDIVCGTVVLKK